MTGGKLTFDSAEKVESLFVAASEVLKASRSNELSKTKTSSSTKDSKNPFDGIMTPEKMNQLNAKYYNKA